MSGPEPCVLVTLDMDLGTGAFLYIPSWFCLILLHSNPGRSVSGKVIKVAHIAARVIRRTKWSQSDCVSDTHYATIVMWSDADALLELFGEVRLICETAG